tara:strand:- start:28 stop:957 length:930 start_codon:yes stop_codon:yes gene_type:complete
MNLYPSTQKILFELGPIFQELVELHQANKLPNKILLSGAKGIGKSTLAYHLINFILSEDEENRYKILNYEINPENISYKLLRNKSHPNFNLVDVAEDKKNIDINQIRDLITKLNKSSFNNKSRFILIDNIDLLNINSINALLKILEEPNENVFFILINNNKKVLSTLKSRCLSFKVFLTNEQSIKVVNQLLNDDLCNIINTELFDHYSTPGQLLNLINLSQLYDIDLNKINLRELLSLMIKNKIYKKDKSFTLILFSYIELYFRSNISVNSINLFELYRYFISKINNTKIYNLDEETLFIEFEDKVLNG